MMAGKNQHYVPNFVLKNFAGDDSTLWVLDKEEGRISCIEGKEDPPRYDAFTANEYLPGSVDDSFGVKESKAAQVITKIIKQARNGDVPNLGPRQMKILCHFLLLQITRVPRVKEFSEDLSASLYHEMLVDDVEGDEGVAHPNRALFNRMRDLDLGVVVAPDPGVLSLLVGDEPCMCKGELTRPGDLVTMRIAKDVLLQLRHPDDDGGWHFVAEDEFVRALNVEAFNTATRFLAGPDRAQVEAFVGLI